MQKAIIYCRVSSDKQVREGHGLEGQEKRCRDYAIAKGYEVIRVFRDAGVSGSLTNRPAMQALIAYLRDMRFSEVVIVFDDIKRFARNVEGHFELKAMLMSHGAKLESPSHRFEDSPEGKLVESIFASVAEYERNANKTQVSNRMKARMQLGYWVLYPPTGYKHEKHPIEGKLITPVEPVASIIKEALEGFANNLFCSQEDVRQFLLKKKFPFRGKTVHPEQVKRILTQPLYAGIIDYPKWSIKPFQGRHKALITASIFNKSRISFLAALNRHLRVNQIMMISLSVVLLYAQVVVSRILEAGLKVAILNTPIIAAIISNAQTHKRALRKTY